MYQSHLLVSALSLRVSVLRAAGRDQEAEDAQRQLARASGDFGIEGPGQLPPASIERVLDGAREALAECYNEALARDPKLQGRVQVVFEIGADGTVTRTRSPESAIADAELVACVLRVHRGLRFPKPTGGFVTVARPIVFAPKGTQSERSMNQ